MSVKFKPYNMIQNRSDFLAANKGRRFATKGFVLLVHDRKDGDDSLRLGITVTKKIGNAVVRNALKRRLRSLAREFLANGGKAGADHILIGRIGGIDREYALMREDMILALSKVGKAKPKAESQDISQSDAQEKNR